MFVKRYIAKDMAQAMEKIRKDLGSDAVILSHRLKNAFNQNAACILTDILTRGNHPHAVSLQSFLVDCAVISIYSSGHYIFRGIRNSMRMKAQNCIRTDAGGVV